SSQVIPVAQSGGRGVRRGLVMVSVTSLVARGGCGSGTKAFTHGAEYDLLCLVPSAERPRHTPRGGPGVPALRGDAHDHRRPPAGSRPRPVRRRPDGTRTRRRSGRTPVPGASGRAPGRRDPRAPGPPSRGTGRRPPRARRPGDARGGGARVGPGEPGGGGGPGGARGPGPRRWTHGRLGPGGHGRSRGPVGT